MAADAADGQAPASASPTRGDGEEASPWTSGFEALGKPGWLDHAKERWEFEEDTYSLGILSMFTLGSPGGLPHIGLALVTPVIQLAAFFRIYEQIISEPRESDEKLAASCSLYVRMICFLLMALQLSNEALEGFKKLVFTLRCFAGIYSNIKGIACLGILLSFFQFGMSIGTVGLSMLVVSEQQTALGAFMNFVALAFLTEIDNILLSARTVQNFVRPRSVFDAQLAPNAFGGGESRPWTVEMMLVTNVLVAASVSVMCLIFWLTAELSPDMESVQLGEHLLSSAMVWITWNLVMWIMGKRVGTQTTAKTVMLAGWAFDLVDKLYVYTMRTRLFSPITMSVMYWFEMATPAVAMAVERDCQKALDCPIRTPLLVWGMLIQSVFVFDSLYRFGLA